MVGKRRVGFIVILAFAWACGADEPRATGQTAFVDFKAFREVEAGNDPFASHRPAEVRCEQFGDENVNGVAAFEVDTAKCNYLTAAQPSITSINRGDQLSIRVWHYELTAREPAEAHMAIRIGEEVVWEAHVPIPSESAGYTEMISLDFNAPAGTPVYFHLHNHGENAWALLELNLHAK